MKKCRHDISILITVFSCLTTSLLSQEIPQPLNNTGIYDFLDELANSQIISVISAIKPYSRLFIAEKLKEADDNREQLSVRQQKELDFYMRDFGKELKGVVLSGTGAQGFRGRNKASLNEGGSAGGRECVKRFDLFYYRDSMFSLTVNPILGGEVFTNSAGQATYWRNGVEARAYIKKWGFFASLRDNHEKPLLGLPSYLIKREGGHLKANTDWSDMQGGITYSWKWGHAGLVKDEIEWGNSYNGANIFGGNNPSYIQLRLHLEPVKWFSFDYFHGWLNSMVVDSARSYWLTNSYGTDYREKYHKKSISANMFTFTPFKQFYISAGNSIIYDDSYVNPSYLMPLFFYKSVDHSVTSGIDNMNSQMFFDISSRQIRNLHLFVTLFVDELSVERFSRNDEWNFLSWKTGFRLGNFPVSNLFFTGEFTYTYPLTFQHYVTTTTFESNNYNLGHYLKDNSREWYAAIEYKPVRTLNIKLWFVDAIRGPDYTELGTPRVGNPPLESVQWHNTSAGLSASYQIINDLYVWASFTFSDISGDARWTPGYLYGRKNTFNIGITFGF